MKAIELRTNNYIIHWDEITRLTGVQGNTISFEDGFNMINFTVDEVKEIPLSEEIFSKIKGAAKNKDNCWSIPFCGSIRLYLVNGFVQEASEFAIKMNFSHINSLHRLQNFYFENTNIELEIKL